MSTTHISTIVKGSLGYLDPEYYRRQRLTEKSDVYSFGVVLCEVLCARAAVIHTEDLKQASLAEWAKTCHQNGELDQIIDASSRDKIAAECLNKFTEIAISCMHEDGTERPSMTAVVSELEHAFYSFSKVQKEIARALKGMLKLKQAVVSPTVPPTIPLNVYLRQSSLR